MCSTFATLSPRPLCLYFVDLEPCDNNKNIFNLQFLCNMKSTVEAPRKKNSILQSTRCQSYGHIKIYCTRQFVCVQSGGDHDTAECAKDPAFPPTCSFCGGAHPANYKGCDVYHRLQKARSHSNSDYGVLTLARPFHTLKLATLISSFPCYTLTHCPTPQTPIHLFPRRRLRIPDH